MTEIELKARVADYESTRRALSAFAAYEGRYDKRDTYWRQRTAAVSGGKQALSIRLRRECPLAGTDSAQPQPDASAGTTVATYKREKRQQADSCTIEINDEQEFAVSDEAAFAAFLLDAGFAVSHEKRKFVEKWRYGQALLELCTVPPLGDFLEIEILSQAGDNAAVAGARRELELLLARSGVPLSAVENRYYSEMLGITRRNAEPSAFCDLLYGNGEPHRKGFDAVNIRSAYNHSASSSREHDIPQQHHGF